MRIAILVIYLSLSGYLSVSAQQGTIVSGSVTDKDGVPLPGADIFIHVLNLGAAADLNGKYGFTIPAEEVRGQIVNLTAQFVGYKTQTVSVTLNPGTIIQNFSLEQDIFRSEEVVVTGIASRTSESTAEVSVSRVNAASLTDISSYQTMSQLVEGKISGVQINSSSGNTGGGFRFFVRGGGGLNGNEQPVIYLDGIRVDNDEVAGFGTGGQGISTLATLDPEDIQQVEVLKGPAAAAMYGTSGSNGVVLITTKSGISSSGIPHALSINYKYVYGLNTQSYKYKTADFLSANNANDIFRNGVIRQNTINLSGGSKSLGYYASFDDRSEEGSIPSNGLDRKAIRAVLTSYTTPDLTFKFYSGYSFTNISRPINDNNIMGFLGNTLLFPESYQFTDSASVFNLSDRNNIESFNAGAQISYLPADNLEFYFSGGADNSNLRDDQTFPQNFPVPVALNGLRAIYNRGNKQFTYEFNGRYSYNLLSGLRGTSVIGAQLFDRTYKESWLMTEDFASELITDIGAGSKVDSYGEYFENRREAGIFTEHNFSYNNQYFLTLGLRQDFSSSIGAGAPGIIYPKASFALRFDKYSWFPSGAISLFKLRAAYGENGQLPDVLDHINLLWGATTGGYGAGATVSNIGNSSIKPERIKELEAGIETEFLRDYSLEFTYYHQKADNSIVYIRESPSSGLTDSDVPFNIGGMKNWGIEALLRTSLINSSDYRIDIGINLNYQNNKVTSLGGAEPIFDNADVNVIKEGMPKHEFYTWKVLGAKFNPDGTYAGVNATNDRVDYGNPIPAYTGSVSINFKFLRNINLYVLADWAKDRKMFNYTKLFAARFGNVPEYNTLQAQLGLTANNPDITRLTPGTTQYIEAADKYARMDYRYKGNYIEDADFLKIRELGLSYSLKDILSGTGYNYIKDITMGISVLNVWTLTNYSGADVELDSQGSRSLSRGMDFLTLQHPRAYNFWVRVIL